MHDCMHRTGTTLEALTPPPFSHSPWLLQANPKVFMDIAISGQALGRIVMELKEDVTPKSA